MPISLLVKQPQLETTSSVAHSISKFSFIFLVFLFFSSSAAATMQGDGSPQVTGQPAGFNFINAKRCSYRLSLSPPFFHYLSLSLFLEMANCWLKVTDRHRLYALAPPLWASSMQMASFWAPIRAPQRVPSCPTRTARRYIACRITSCK